MKYYGYIRVSTPTQAEKGYGLDAQRLGIEKYAADNGAKIERVFSDEGVSGDIGGADADETARGRPGLMELLSVLEEGDAVVVLNTSRLWRGDMTKAVVKRELLRRGAAVISVEQPHYELSGSDPEEYLINAITEALDVYERMNISLKLARGRAVKADGGAKPAGVCPYGYMYSDDKKSVVPCPGEAVTVIEIFALTATGHSLSETASILNGKGVTTRRRNEWSRAALHALLHNRFYIGELTHAGKVIKGTHPPLVSRAVFGKAASRLGRRRKN